MSQLADVAEQLVWQYGVGHCTYKPLPKPLPALASIQTGPLSNQELLVQVAWTDANGNEGSLSPALGLEVAERVRGGGLDCRGRGSGAGQCGWLERLSGTNRACPSPGRITLRFRLGRRGFFQTQG